ncbi:hypothetical protein C8R43DRAFT_1118538 [Mycena crocata]|nr:hypothetical protein C8R43DRAFT_1118538 [Mycena crocata]
MDRLFAPENLPVNGYSKPLLLILSHLDYDDITNVQLVSHGMREYTVVLHAQKYTGVIATFFPAYVDAFSSTLLTTEGAITGSCTYATALPNLKMRKTNLNVVVPVGKAQPVLAFLDDRQWVGWKAEVAPWWKDTATAHYCYEKSVDGDTLTVTVTETRAPSIHHHVLRARHSLASAIMSPACITFFHRPTYITAVRYLPGAERQVRILAGRGVLSTFGGTRGRFLSGGKGIGGIVWGVFHRYSALRDVHAFDLARRFTTLAYDVYWHF